MMFVSLDDVLHDHIMSSHSVIKLFLQLWTRRGHDGATYFVTFQQELCCILDLLNGFLKDDLGRSTLFETLDRNPDMIGIIAQTLRVRIQQLVHHYSSERCTWKFAIFHLRELLIFISKLLRTHRTWLAFFKSGELLRAIPETLWSITTGKTSADRWKSVVQILQQVSELTLDAPLGTYPALLKIIPLVKGGVMLLLAKSVNYIPAQSREHSFAFLMFQHLAAYSIYHEVSPAVGLAVGQLSGAVSTDNINPHERDRADGLNQFRVCDAVNHVHPPSSTTFGMQQCSFCRSVVYCSKDCQSRDWREFHRRECRHQALIWNRRHLQGWASSMNRSYFVSLVCEVIRTHDIEFENIRNARRMPSPLDALVRFVNCRTAPPTVDVVTIADYKMRTVGAPDYLKARTRAYLNQASLSSNVFVAEALFPESYTLPYQSFTGNASISQISREYIVPFVLNAQ
ncbi:hypothetical protein MD484_g5659, partial [Candolleomyces efflorescens]